MTTNKSIYQPTPYEIEWVVFEGTEEEKQKIAEWAYQGYDLAIEDDGDEWVYKTSSDYGSSDWNILPLGSLICRKWLDTPFFFVVLPDRVDTFKQNLVTLQQ